MLTELNPNAIEDSSISKSKLDAAFKTEIEGKQDTLIAGTGIDITDNTISCTFDTTIFKIMGSLPAAPASGDENKTHLVLSSSSEEGDTYEGYIWVNNSWERVGSFRPSIDLSNYTEKSYVDTQISELQTQINSKQEALTLTVKDNGNIVLTNIQGQSKEFMPATPSGDPMHYIYVTAGAEYNDTGVDIIRPTPWADMIDDDYSGDYGKTVVHKAGYWYLNGLGDLTTDEIRKIYQLTSNFPESLYLDERLRDLPIRTNFFNNKPIGGWGYALIGGLIYHNNNIISLAFANISVAKQYDYTFWSSSLKHIIGVIQQLSAADNISIFGSITTIISVKIKNLRINLPIISPNLSVKSVLYMINNEAATSPITITLHADVYNRCMSNADILTSLQAHTNVSLADGGATA